MREELLNQVALSLSPGIGPITIKQLISYCGSATEVLKTSAARLEAIPGIGKKTIEAITSKRCHREALEQLEQARKQNATIYSFTDPDYPSRLKSLDNAPVVLYAKGQPAFNNRRTIGIVGTRRATDYGKRAIRRLLGQLKPYGPTILSGLAYGVDIDAHREALRQNLPTVAVLGSGLDQIYPEGHENTAREMLSTGGLVTELKFGTKPEVYHFPSRNRIIAGLSDALVVVEARKRGGALITASYIKSYGKPCFAVPGPIDSPASIGCNQLLMERKAHFLTSGSDLVDLLGWSLDKEKQSVLPGNRPAEELIIQSLKGRSHGLHIDEISRRTQIPINKTGTCLLNLEIQGILKALPGKKFILVGK